MTTFEILVLRSLLFIIDKWFSNGREGKLELVRDLKDALGEKRESI
jgi:hypothetical protein